MHDYVPDFILLLRSEPPSHLILEVKGYDPLAEVKRAAAERWVNAVNAGGTNERWEYAIARKPSEVDGILRDALAAQRERDDSPRSVESASPSESRHVR